VSSHSILDNIQIVLVEPQHPGNIGSSARGMKNMGLKHLVLVSPPKEWFEGARIMAANSTDLLKRARTFLTISEAVSDSIFVVGMTRRGGEARSPAELKISAIKRILKKATQGQVSILFGNERVGLSEQELSDCHLNLSITTSPDQPSLNLSHAVLLLTYELFRNSDAKRFPVIRKDRETYLAKESDLDEMCRLVLPALTKLGYTNSAKRKHLGTLVKTIKRTAKKSEFEIREVKMIEGLARRILDSSAEPHFRLKTAPFPS